MDVAVLIYGTLEKSNREYNNVITIKEYKRYVRKFPTRQFLGLLGYEVQEYEYLDYNAPVDAPQDLFKED